MGSESADNNGLVASSSFGDDLGNATGSGYLFKAFDGTEIAKLLASDGQANDLFGRSITIANNTVYIDSPSNDGLTQQTGSIYLYDFNCAANITGDLSLNFFDVSAFLAAFAKGCT